MIAQTGFDGKIQKFDKVRTDQLLWDVIETLKESIPETIYTLISVCFLIIPKSLKYRNEQLLHLALANIISNGCKYSNFQQVRVSLGATDTDVYIIVKMPELVSH